LEVNKYMAAVVTGSKTCTQNLSPALTAATLSSLLAIAPENLTIAQLGQIVDGTKRVAAGSNPAATVSQCFL
jgi:hypothetical protein